MPHAASRFNVVPGVGWYSALLAIGSDSNEDTGKAKTTHEYANKKESIAGSLPCCHITEILISTPIVVLLETRTSVG